MNDEMINILRKMTESMVGTPVSAVSVYGAAWSPDGHVGDNLKESMTRHFGDMAEKARGSVIGNECHPQMVFIYSSSGDGRMFFICDLVKGMKVTDGVLNDSDEESLERRLTDLIVSMINDKEDDICAVVRIADGSGLLEGKPSRDIMLLISTSWGDEIIYAMEVSVDDSGKISDVALPLITFASDVDKRFVMEHTGRGLYFERARAGLELTTGIIKLPGTGSEFNAADIQD